MRIQKERINSPIGLGYNQNAIFQMLPERTIQKLVINHPGIPRDVFRRVAFELNGFEPIITNGGFLNDVETYRGGFVHPYKTVLAFGEHSNRTLQGQMRSGLPVVNRDNAVLKLELGDAPSADAGAPQITIDAYTSRKQGRVFIPRIRTLTENVRPNGETVIPFRDAEEGVEIKRIWFQASDIVHLRVEQAGRKIWESSVEDHEYDQKVGSRKPRPGYFCFDPTHTGWGIDDLIDTVSRDTRLDLIVTTSGERTDNTLPMIVEQVDQVAALNGTMTDLGG